MSKQQAHKRAVKWAKKNRRIRAEYKTAYPPYEWLRGRGLVDRRPDRILKAA